MFKRETTPTKGEGVAVLDLIYYFGLLGIIILIALIPSLKMNDQFSKKNPMAKSFLLGYFLGFAGIIGNILGLLFFIIIGFYGNIEFNTLLLNLIFVIPAVFLSYLIIYRSRIGFLVYILLLVASKIPFHWDNYQRDWGKLIGASIIWILTGIYLYKRWDDLKKYK